MKSKKIKVLVIILILMFIPINILAYGGIDTTNITIGGSDAAKSSVSITNRIVGTLQVVGTIISVIALIIIGMRYMFSSVEEKAQMKGVLGYYIIGCVLVFATSNVLAFAYDIINDVQHSYVDTGLIIKEATCVETGKKERKCTGSGGLCNCTEDNPHIIHVTTPIDSNAHNWSEWKVTKHESCTDDGTQTRTCKNGCGKTETQTRKAIGHDWEIGKVIEPAKCTEEGYKADKCNNCGEEKNKQTIAAIGHSIEKGKLIKAATCTTDGKKADKCKNCEYKENEQTIPAGHDWEIGKVIEPAKCTEEGYKADKCKNCGEEKNKQTIAATGHAWSGETYVGATCTEIGYKQKTCITCGEVTKEKTADPLGHGPNQAECVINNDRTHKYIYKCRRCNIITGESENYSCTMQYTGERTRFGLNYVYKFRCGFCGFERHNELSSRKRNMVELLIKNS